MSQTEIAVALAKLEKALNGLAKTQSRLADALVSASANVLDDLEKLDSVFAETDRDNRKQKTAVEIEPATGELKTGSTQRDTIAAGSGKGKMVRSRRFRRARTASTRRFPLGRQVLPRGLKFRPRAR
jgi:hypothetical protein